MDTDLKAKTDKLFDNWQTLFDRMQDDAVLFNLVQQNKQLTRPDEKGDERAIPNSLIVPLNDIADFDWRVETALNNAVEQVAVESEVKRFDTAYIEAFIKAVFKEADKRMPGKDLYPLNPFIDQQTCRRGQGCLVPLFTLRRKELIADITPWDTGYVVSTPALRAYRVSRTKEQLEGLVEEIRKVYPRWEFPVIPDSEDIEFHNIWTDTRNEMLINSVPFFEQKNTLGYNPVIYHKVPMGSMLLDKDTRQYQGESLIMLVRDLVPELQRLASIIQSMNIKAYDHALQRKLTPELLASRPPPADHDKVTAPGAVSDVPVGGGYESMPYEMLSQQATLLHTIIQNRIDRSMATVFQSSLSPKTATEILGAASERENIVSPRIATRGLLKQDAAEMGIKQTIAACERAGIAEFKMGNQTWDASKLKGEYTIEFRYTFRDPNTDIARASMATSMKGLGMISDEDILTDVMKRPDAKGDLRRFAHQEARRLNPLLDIRDKILKIIDDIDEGGDDTEWEVMCDSQYCPQLEQAIMGQQVTPGEKPALSQPLIKTIAGQGG